jgi:integrase
MCPGAELADVRGPGRARGNVLTWLAGLWLGYALVYLQYVDGGLSYDPPVAFPPNNILNRIVVAVRDEANRLLAEREQEPIERLTPHTLRRTFASILVLCEVHPRRARQ